MVLWGGNVLLVSQNGTALFAKEPYFCRALLQKRLYLTFVFRLESVVFCKRALPTHDSFSKDP